jgi:hypothetical protein
MGLGIPLGAALILRLLFRPLSELLNLWKTAALLLVACTLSERWIISDETRFAVEASKASGVFSRDRAWPNHGCSLVYIPGRGIHATD